MKNEIYYSLNSPEIQYLRKADDRLESLISRIGDYHLSLETNYFESLIRIIIGQQLSVNVARKIWSRLKEYCIDINVTNIIQISEEELKSLGVSSLKATYIKNFAKKIEQNFINLNNLSNYSDDEIINKLTQIKGIGQWTSEMFMIFSLGRPDIISVSDIGLKRAIKWLYALSDFPTPVEIMHYSEKWCPYRSIASLYLWESVNRDLIKTPI